MGRRHGIRPSLRFRVLKRDNFQCHYCGAGARESKLQVDHVKPVASGGTNDIENLVVACVDCNIGKGAEDCFITRDEHEVMMKQLREDHASHACAVAAEVVWHRFGFNLDDDKGVARNAAAWAAAERAAEAGMSLYHITHYAMSDLTWGEWLETMDPRGHGEAMN